MKDNERTFTWRNMWFELVFGSLGLMVVGLSLYLYAQGLRDLSLFCFAGGMAGFAPAFLSIRQSWRANRL